ncbi:MAG: hypothetical protein M3Y03_01375 [Verrucomicrobiota bacterium]|nr:hypothetical protein [Verrucomicrobiota bacterium]
MKCLLLLLSIVSVSFAQVQVRLQDSDTVGSILKTQVGQNVELRMKSGEKLGGKVDQVTERLAHLSQLSGAEFYDAVVNLEDVAAVVVRTKTK